MFQSFFAFVVHFVFQSVSNIPVAAPTSIVVVKPTMTTTPTITPSSTPTPTITPSPKPTATPTITPSPKPTVYPQDISLLNEINIYRREQNKSEIATHPLLCSIANQRVEELKNKGSLDNHEGIKKHIDQLKSTFISWHEVIYFSSPPKTSHNIVKEGWIPSDPHKQSITNDQVNYGCGAQKEGFAVFILTEKK